MKKKQLVIDSQDLSEYLEKGWLVKSEYNHAGVQIGYIVEKKIKNNLVQLVNNIKCPRVLFRLECQKCGYSSNESLYSNEDKYCNGVLTKDIPCKYDILQNNVKSNNEQPKHTNKRCSCSTLKKCDQSCM